MTCGQGIGQGFEASFAERPSGHFSLYNTSYIIRYTVLTSVYYIYRDII